MVPQGSHVVLGPSGSHGSIGPTVGLWGALCDPFRSLCPSMVPQGSSVVLGPSGSPMSTCHERASGEPYVIPIDPCVSVWVSRDPTWCWDPVDRMGVQGPLWDSGEPCVSPVDPLRAL